MLRALNHHVERSDLDTVATALLGAVKGMIGLCQQIGNIKRPLLAMNQPDADRRADWMTVHILGHLREAFTNPLSHLDRFLATGLSKHGGELLPTQPADQIRPTHRLSRGASEYRQHAVADRVAKTIVDQFEMVKIDRQDSSWSRVVAVALGEQQGILQKRAAICDTGERGNHGSSAVAEFCALLRHRKRDKGA